MKSYQYQERKGQREISWEDFARLGSQLVEALAPAGIDIVLGIARAGLFPATFISLALRRELYPVRLTRRLNDVVQFEEPVWRVDVPAAVRGAHVAVVDEITDTGRTLALVVRRADELGAAKVATASLITHTWAQPQPDFTSLVSDELILFPWDRRVFQEGRWIPHPEIEAAMKSRQA